MDGIFSAPFTKLFKFQLSLSFFLLRFSGKIINSFALFALKLNKWFLFCCHGFYEFEEDKSSSLPLAIAREPEAGIEPATSSLPKTCSAN
jgi:hypothetical protein